MVELEEEIRRLVRKIAKEEIHKGSKNRLCLVTATDDGGETFDCNPLDGGAEMFSVRLNAVIGGDSFGLTMMPEEQSLVIVGTLDGNKNSSFLVMATDFKWIRIVLNDETYLKVENDKNVYITAPKIQMNDGSKGGMINIAQLVEKINALETAHNGLATFLGALPVPVSGAVSGPPVEISTDPFKIQIGTVREDLEDTTITH